MRFVVFSDLHLHEWVYGSRIVNGRNSRLEQQVRVVHDIVNYCKSEGISEAVLTGDVFHTSTVSAAVSEAAYRAFSEFNRAGIHLTIVPGNHDQATRTGELDSLSWFSTIGTVARCGDSGVDRICQTGDVQAYGIPFTHDRGELARRIDQIPSGCRLLYLHQGVSGVEINSKGFTLNEALTPDMIPPWIGMAFTGHYHSAKQVTDNLVIPGSTVQLNWGDKDERRGWLDVDYNPEDNTTAITHMEAKASKFVQADDVSGLDGYAVEGNFLRVVTEDNTPSFVQSLVEDLYKRGAESVEIKNVIQVDNAIKLQTTQFNSLNEIIYAYAHEKERAGVIDEYDRLVGEQLLKGNYQVPNA